MPRSGWLAGGAVAAALLLPALAGLDPRLWPIVPALAIGLATTLAGVTRRRRVTALAALVGAAAVALRLSIGLASTGASAVPLQPGRGTWPAMVEALAAPRQGQQLATLELLTDAGELPVAATLPRYPSLRTGMVVRVAGSVEAPPDDDYGDYLRRIGVAGTLRGSSLQLLDAGAADPVSDVRAEAADALARVLPEPEAGLAAGILIGTRERVDRDLAAAFTAAGVSHIVAISGWNIAIVAAAIGALVRRARRRTRTIVILLAVATYVVLAGASPSVVRAGVMAAVVLIARETGRAGVAAAALGWAVAVLVLAEPGMASDAGFGLSVLATAGLLAWATQLTAAIARIGRRRLPGPIAESLGVSLAAQAATLPLILVVFGRLAIVAPAVNLAVVPLVVPAMLGGGIALLAGGLVGLGLPQSIGAVGALPAWLPLHVLIAVVRFGAGLPGAGLVLEPALGFALAVAAALVIASLGTARGRGLLRSIGRLVCRPLGLARSGAPMGHRPASSAIAAPRPTRGARRPRLGRTERVLGAGLAVAIAGLLVAAQSRPDGRLRISVLDVGQGDAILIQGDLGGRLLIDGGPDPERLLAQLDGRLPPWDHRIDIVVLTHPHEDHVGGLPLLLERYRIGRIFEPGMRGPGPGYAAFEATLRSEGRTTGRLSTDDELRLDDASFRVLWPDRDAVPKPRPTPGRGSTTSRSCSSGHSGGSASC